MGVMYEVCIEMNPDVVMHVSSFITNSSGFHKFVCTEMHKHRPHGAHIEQKIKQVPWPESASKVDRPRDRCLSAKLLPTFADTWCHMVSVTNPYGRNLGFLYRSRYFFFQVAPQLYPRGCVDPVPDQLLLRKSGSARNRTRTSGSVARNSND
jgi:hypothetical protein